MSHSHEHKQLGATEMPFSDCAMNDLSQKSRQTTTVPVTNPMTSIIKFTATRFQKPHLTQLLHSTLCCAKKHGCFFQAGIQARTLCGASNDVTLSLAL